ncbi:MAG: hypothetical protein AB8F34_10130, partial [Akkermansiaceae bacterium]
CVIFQLTREPVNMADTAYHSGKITGCVWLMLGIYAFLSWITCWIGWRIMRPKWKKHSKKKHNRK